MSLDVPSPVQTGRGGAAVPVLRTEGLTIRFGGLTALNNVNFALRRDEICAIIGPNGAGKSTFFNCLTGVLRPTSGRIMFNGDDITGLTPDKISQKGIARSYQITSVFPNFTVLENLALALRLFLSGRPISDKPTSEPEAQPEPAAPPKKGSKWSSGERFPIPREILDEDPELGSPVLGETTGSDEPATERGIDPSGGDEADATSDGGAELPEGAEPDLKDAAGGPRQRAQRPPAAVL